MPGYRRSSGRHAPRTRKVPDAAAGSNSWGPDWPHPLFVVAAVLLAALSFYTADLVLLPFGCALLPGAAVVYNGRQLRLTARRALVIAGRAGGLYAVAQLAATLVQDYMLGWGAEYETSIRSVLIPVTPVTITIGIAVYLLLAIARVVVAAGVGWLVFFLLLRSSSGEYGK